MIVNKFMLKSILIGKPTQMVVKCRQIPNSENGSVPLAFSHEWIHVGGL